MDNNNNINWDDMRFLLALQREKSALKAARILQVSHQTVSRRLAGLEKNLGARLVNRSGATWSLTVIGQDISHRAEEIENAMRAVARTARSDANAMSGRIVITSASMGFEYFVVPAIAEIRKRFPLIEFDLVADDRSRNMQSGQFDIALRFTKSPPGDLLGRNAGQVSFSFYGLANHINTFDKALVANTTITLPLVVLTTSHLRTARWHPEQIDPTSTITHVNDITTLISTVRNGLGLGYLPTIAAQNYSQLIASQQMSTYNPFDAWILTNEDSRQSAKIKLVSRHLFEFVRHLLN